MKCSIPALRDGLAIFLRGIYAELCVQQTRILDLFKQQEYAKFLQVARVPFAQKEPEILRNKERLRQVLATMAALSQINEIIIAAVKVLLEDAHLSEEHHAAALEAAETGLAVAPHTEAMRRAVESLFAESESTKSTQEMIGNYVLLQRELLQVEVVSAIAQDSVDVEDPDPSASSLRRR